MTNLFRAVPLLIVLVSAGCRQQAADPPVAPTPGAIGAGETVSAPADASPVELSDAQLCQLLTAEEVTKAIASERTASPHSLGGCQYQNPSRPALRLFNSPHASQGEHLEMIKGLKGSCKDAPGGALLCSIGFDAQNGKVSAIWFEHAGAALEIESDAGLSEPEALALLEPARN